MQYSDESLDEPVVAAHANRAGGKRGTGPLVKLLSNNAAESDIRELSN